jgi:phage terminase large subunit
MDNQKNSANPNYLFLWANIILQHIRYIVLEGGTRSGKTYSTLAFIIEFCYLNQGKGYEFGIARKTLAALKSTAYKDFINILKEWKIYDVNNHNKSEYIYTLWGNTISFLGSDNDDKLKGFSCDFLYCNEAIELDSAEWLQLKLRTRLKIIVDYNPSEFEHYLYDELDPDDSAVLLVTTYRDNPHLPNLQVKEIEKLKGIDETLYQIYADGKRGKLKGLVYIKWTIVDSMPRNLKKHGYGLDFGFTNDPTALIECGLNEGFLYLDELVYETGLTNPDLFNLAQWDVDNTLEIVADSADPKSIKELNNLGWTVIGAEKGPDSVRSGINLIKSYDLRVTKRSENIIKELRRYKWKIGKDGKETGVPIDKYNHALDALRYYALHFLLEEEEVRMTIYY